ncbi:MAG: VCBS repeat-containing protein, partial [Nannocystaceae bacterium]
LEIVRGGSIWAWDPNTKDMVPEPYFTGNGAAAFTAVADFGDFPGVEGDAPGRPEVVAMSPGAIRVQTIAGALLFGPVTLPGGGDGGNVTIADFDGDGAPEFGVVGSTLYVVYDPACGDNKFAGECASGSMNGILWQAQIRENSCAIMGSTVFDFEGDKAAEVVYADECYVRVFSGTDGAVIWSHPRSSATWYEAPIVADSDLDGRAELINTYSGYVGSCAAVDPIFEGIRCTDEFACPTKTLTCESGLCRCTEDADCGDPDMACVDPLPQSPGMGKVCRARYAARTGLRVFSDQNWVGARPIWNQHAYSVTNVETDGTIPKGDQVARNWQVAGLNNFRQNTQDDLGVIPGPDITVEGVDYNKDCSARNPILLINAQVCNRGKLAVDPGVQVDFYDGDPDVDGMLLCSTETTMTLEPAQCEAVICVWMDPPINTGLDVHIIADGDNLIDECYELNNEGDLPVQCPPPAPK